MRQEAKSFTRHLLRFHIFVVLGVKCETDNVTCATS